MVAALVVLVGGIVGALPSVAGAQGTNDLLVTGHGWGHGRGMGQYGAYGYADQGWSSARILDHFYGGTTAGTVPSSASVDPDRVRVELRFMRGIRTTVGLTSGTIVLLNPAGTELARLGDGAVRMHPIAGGYEVQTGSSCGGPWLTRGIVPGPTVRMKAESSATGADALLHTCGVGQRVWYEGELAALIQSGSPTTVNTVTIEQYLRGVVPSEMPALWPSAALEAQAVAARSYALAGDTRQQPYADTCDTIRCQVYDGAYVERSNVFRVASHPRTDAAIVATSGVVRLKSNGAVARTEFSSSTGGYTAGGDFTAVADSGDNIAANPNHQWATTVSSATIEGRYGLGRLLSADVVTRNGLGAEGGRVKNVRFEFQRGTVFETGNRLRQILGLKSDWFSFGAGSGSELRATAEGKFIDQAYLKLGGRVATNAELVGWWPTIESGSRATLTTPLAVDRHHVGLLIDDLYRTSFGRPADTGGRNHWRSAVDQGLSIEALGVLLLGSEEYYQLAGGTDTAYVSDLYRSVLGREPDLVGLAYWVRALSEDRVGRLDIASGFYASPESRSIRAGNVYRRLVGPDVPPQMLAVLADQLQSIDERVLAAQIAASSTVYRQWSN